MKYLLPFLDGLSDGPDLNDPDFQSLLVDVQAGKSSQRSADAFYESLEKIINELKSTPESTPFQRPVSKRDAPDYHLVIKHPMDLQTMMKNIKNHKYKSKAEFAADLDLIWENCFFYNTSETHPIRAQARFMKQKTEHHLEFLADKNERGASNLLALPIRSESSRQGASAPTQPSPLRASTQLPGEEEDAAGESDDAGPKDAAKAAEPFPGEAGAGPQSDTAASTQEKTKQTSPGPGGGGSDSRTNRESSVLSAGGDKRGGKPNGIGRSTAPYRPKLQTSLETSQAFVRTPYTMTHHLALSLNHAGPSSLTQGRAKELLQSTPPPLWYPGSVTSEDEELHLEGSWWGVISKDESYTAGLPAVPTMLEPHKSHPLRIPQLRRRISVSHDQLNGHEARTPPLDPPKPVKLEKVILQSVNKLNEARKVMGLIHDWQRLEMEGGLLPNIKMIEAAEKAQMNELRRERKRVRKEEAEEANKRRKMGGRIGEKEAAHSMRKAAAGLLAHAGFEGANEVALDMFTRVAADHLRNLGQTFRLLIDGFSQKMPSDEIILHALHESGQIQLQDLEAHIKDDIEREGGKITEMTRKVKQAYKEVATAPVIEDDMLFNENGAMLTDGNFAEELGEDFLGLREMGIDKEFGLSSLTVPSSLFYGRRKRPTHADTSGPKEDALDYPPPPPFVPLNPSTIPTHLPALLHAFYAARMESGKGVSEDEPFDYTRSQISSLGQIIHKNPQNNNAAAKKKRDGEGDGKSMEKKIKPKKAIQPGVGKGNWIRPPKEEREKKAAEKRASEGKVDVSSGPAPVVDDEDAEGEEE